MGLFGKKQRKRSKLTVEEYLGKLWREQFREHPDLARLMVMQKEGISQDDLMDARNLIRYKAIAKKMDEDPAFAARLAEQYARQIGIHLPGHLEPLIKSSNIETIKQDPAPQPGTK